MFPFELNLSGPAGTALTLAVLLMSVVNFAMALFWMTIGWRAMKAHERLGRSR